MEDNRKRNLIVAGMMVLALIALILVLWWMLRDIGGVIAPNAPAPTNTATTPLPTTSTNPAVTTPVTPKPVEVAPPDDRNNLRGLVMGFAERYGSFSNSSDFENMLDLKVFMTSSLAQKTEAQVTKLQAARKAATNYNGTTTRSLSAVVTLTDGDTKATAVVKTQRTERTDTTQKVYYQDVTFSLEKQGDKWLVDDIAWAKL